MLDVVAILRGESSDWACAVTWVPVEALGELAGRSLGTAGDSLTSLAEAFSLDLVFVPATMPESEYVVPALMDRGIAAGWIVDGPFVRVASQLGWSEAISLTAAEPGELASSLDRALHDLLDEVRLGIAAGARVLMIADELAGTAGWLLSPDFAMDALIPCYRRAISEWRSPGRACVFHSDGDVRVLMPSLGHAGFDSVHFGAPGAASLGSLVQAARESALTPMGGLTAAELSMGGARAAGEHALRTMGSKGFVLSDDGGMTGAEEVAAFGAALEAADRLRDREQSE